MYGPLHESLLNRRHRLCGYRLRPLSYDHLEALHAMGHPLPTKAARINSVHLLTALRVCSLSGRQLEEDFPDAALTWRDCWHVLKHWIRPRTLIADVRAFESYVADHVAAPEVLDAGGDGESSHERLIAEVPALFARMTGVLIAYKGAISERRARSMPIGLLLHYLELALHHSGRGSPFHGPEKAAEISARLDAADEAAKELVEKLNRKHGKT